MKYQATFASIAFLFTAATIGGVNGCGTSTGNPNVGTDDTSISGAAASAAGGALSSTSSSGTVAFAVPRGATRFSLAQSVARAFDFLPSASATVSCPTIKSTGTYCSASGSTLWLSYDSCSYGGSITRSGVQAFIMSSGTAQCGSFPYPGANGSLVRQYVATASSHTPGSFTLTHSSGRVATIDDASANLANFDNDTINAISNSGYGTQINLTNNVRTSIVIGHHISIANTLDQSISGTIDISETSGSTSRTISGSLTIYHNLLKVIGTSTFNNVTHADTCCLPTAGTITTTFSAGANVQPTTAGSKLVGKSETLTLTGCGTGTLQSADGTTTDVTLSRCF